MAKKYEGCTISTGFLVGQLHELSHAWGQYTQDLQKYLEGQFPGAEVNVECQYVEGADYSLLQTDVTIDSGDHSEEEKIAEEVNRNIELFGDIEEWYTPNAEMLYEYLGQSLHDELSVIGNVVNYFNDQNIEHHTIRLGDVRYLDWIRYWEEVEIPQEELKKLMEECLSNDNLQGVRDDYTWGAISVNDKDLWICPVNGW